MKTTLILIFVSGLKCVFNFEALANSLKGLLQSKSDRKGRKSSISFQNKLAEDICTKYIKFRENLGHSSCLKLSNEN